MNKPTKVYIQWYGDGSPDDIDSDTHPSIGDVTWSNDQVFEHDLGPFVLTSEITELRAQLEQVTKERDAWIEDAKRFCRNESFYYGELMKMASLLGREVYISDDGSVQQDPLVLKIYDLFKEQRDAARAQRDRAMELLANAIPDKIEEGEDEDDWFDDRRRLVNEIAKEKEGER